MTQQTPSPTVSPAALALPTSASSSSAKSTSVQAPAQANPRKRPRSDLSPEEKREARAHRNRIAAQNSRDKRKQQFSGLEQRVAELESENRQLRDALATSQPNLVFTGAGSMSEQEKQRESENQELRERIKVLEQGWASVVQALTAAGQAIPSLGLPPSLTTAQRQDQEKSAPMTIVLDSRAQSPSPTASIASKGRRASSPADSSMTASPSVTISSLPASISVDDSTRHPAAGGIIVDTDAVANSANIENTHNFFSLSPVEQQQFLQTYQQQQDPSQTSPTDPQIDAWLQDILQPVPPSPATTTATFTLPSASPVDFQEATSSAVEELMKLETAAMGMNWPLKVEDEANLNELINLIPSISENFDTTTSGVEDLPWAQVSEGLGVAF